MDRKEYCGEKISRSTVLAGAVVVLGAAAIGYVFNDPPESAQQPVTDFMPYESKPGNNNVPVK